MERPDKGSPGGKPSHARACILTVNERQPPAKSGQLVTLFLPKQLRSRSILGQDNRHSVSSLEIQDPYGRVILTEPKVRIVGRGLSGIAHTVEQSLTERLPSEHREQVAVVAFTNRESSETRRFPTGRSEI